MRIFKEFTFESAHRLPNVPDGHRCARLHGHSYRVMIHANGPMIEPAGWVVDYADISEAWKLIQDALDHRYLNDIPGLENPTTERLAVWMWPRLKGRLPLLSRIVVHETHSSGCEYEGE